MSQIIGFLGLVAALATVPAMAQISEVQKSVIADDPKFQPQRLKLIEVPEARGPALSLFNGRDLEEWESWLGYADPSLTFLDGPAEPIGQGGKGTIFKVVTEDGSPALHVNGETWGSIVHKSVLENYHLRLEFKWGKTRHAPRQELPPNNGLLYHSNGMPGAVFGTWMPAVEFQMMHGSVGMALPLGQNIGARTEVGHDPAIDYPMRRFMIGGREVSVEQPAWNVEAATNAERPVGEWNVLDLYVLGDRSIHVVNGVPVMALHDLSVTDPATGQKRPLTKGRVQLQSEGAETYFRNITVEPISSLPLIARE